MKEEATVVIVRHNEPLAVVEDCLTSVCSQEDAELSVLLLDQACGETLNGLSARWPITERSMRTTSLSYCRNYALREAATDIVLFIDCDALAGPRWAAQLIEALHGEDAAVAGSRILLEWPSPRPWWTASQWVQEQYSRFDLGSGTFDVDYIFGAGFGVRRSRLSGKSFSLGLGRRSGLLLGGEELDLCRAVRERGFRVTYAGDAVVMHRISAARTNIRWLMRRAYYGGFTRAILGGLPSASAATWGFNDVIPLCLCALPYATGYCAAALRSAPRQDICKSEAR